EPLATGGFHVDRRACAAGTVNGSSAIADVVRVNGTAGTALSRVVRLPAFFPFTFSLSAPPKGPATGRYLLWIWAGSSFHPTELNLGGERVGCLVNPSPLDSGFPQPVKCLMSSGVPSAVCRGVQEISAPPTEPFSVFRPNGFSHSIRLTLQGL